MANVGTMTKCMHSGHTARMRLESACLANMGFQSNNCVLSDPQGCIAAFGDITKMSNMKLITSFGNPFWLEKQDFGFKRYPSQFSTQFAIESAIELSKKIDPDNIISIEIIWPALHYLDRPNVLNGLAAKFSLQYLVSKSLIEGNITNQRFTEKEVMKPNVQMLISLTTLTFDNNIPSNFNSMYGFLKVRQKDGGNFETKCQFHKGHWHNPANKDQIISKFIDNTKKYLSKSDQEKSLRKFFR